MSWEGGSRLLLLFVALFALGEFRELIARTLGEDLAIQDAGISLNGRWVSTVPSHLRPLGTLGTLGAERCLHVLGHRQFLLAS